jgi:hypothetical protein
MKSAKILFNFISVFLILVITFPSFATVQSNTTTDSTGIENSKLYYIVNAYTPQCMAPNSTSATEYTNVTTVSRAWTQQTLWKVHMTSSGQFQLQSFGGLSGVILEAFGTSIEVESADGDPTEYFVIERINSGAFQGCYYIKQGEYYVTRHSSSGNVYLSNITDSRSIWSFIKSDLGTAEMFNFSFTDNNGVTTNTLGQRNNFMTKFSDLGYTVYSRTNNSSTVAYQRLQDYTDVFLFVGHANSGLIAFFDSSGSQFGAISANGSVLSLHRPNLHIDDLSPNQLSHVRMVLYLGCNSGNDLNNSTNLVNSTYNQGAHFVLGVTDEVLPGLVNEWLYYFIDYLHQGFNINDSMDYAYMMQMQYGNYCEPFTLPTYYVGDTRQYIKIT